MKYFPFSCFSILTKSQCIRHLSFASILGKLQEAQNEEITSDIFGMINAAEGFYWGIIKAYLVTRDLLVFYSSINNDETPSDIFGMINVADGLYWSLIKAYLVPQDLLAFHSSSRKLMTTLSFEAVFEKGYCHSRTSWTSLKRMN